ncbi:MAG: hypothetical protein F6K42_00530 [Leptolyngbya sp. SIO1D8]|nr:hypothetical protein [Leptolyngbya sp. SIO1D8]
MPRKPASESTQPSSSSPAAGAATRRKRRAAPSASNTTPTKTTATPTVATPTNVAMPSPQDEGVPVATGFVEASKQAAIAQTAPSPDFPDPSSYAPPDPMSASSSLPRMEDKAAEEELKAIKEQTNQAKIMQANAKLTGELENLRGTQAHAIQNGVKAAREVEGVFTAVSQYDQQVTSTQISREKQYQGAMELAGLEAARALVERNITARRQLKLNQIQRVEDQAARVLGETIDTPVETIDY